MFYWKKELEMLLRFFKSFRTKDLKAVVDAYPYDGDGRKSYNMLTQLGKVIQISK